MKELGLIEEEVEKISILSGVYMDLKKSKISSEEERELAKTKMDVAKKQMLKLNYDIHMLLKQAKAHIK